MKHGANQVGLHTADEGEQEFARDRRRRIPIMISCSRFKSAILDSNAIV